MNHDPGTIDRDKELLRMWQEMPLPPGSFDAGQLARELADRVGKFDRQIFWRNFREYTAGAALTAWFVWQSFDPARRTISLPGIVLGAFWFIGNPPPSTFLACSVSKP